MDPEGVLDELQTYSFQGITEELIVRVECGRSCFQRPRHTFTPCSRKTRKWPQMNADKPG
jgi:hypothetical protein